jgi:hypothetical protein
MSNETFEQHTLFRDGKEVLKGSMIECIDYIHNTHCYSFDHACKYEGYSIK